MSVRSNATLESAVRCLQIVTDQMPLLDNLQGLFPQAELLEDCVIKVYIELIELCKDCIGLLGRKWYGRFSIKGCCWLDAKIVSANVTTNAFTNAQRTSDARATRVRDLVSSCNWSGLAAHYEAADCRYQTIISEIRSSRPVRRNQVCRLISSPVDDKYITLPKVLDSIEECFTEAIKDTRQGKFAIYGMGGAGKTSLAAHYAKTRVDLKNEVLWLHGKTEDTLNTSLGEAATALSLENLDPAMSSARRRDAVRNYLSHLAGKHLIKSFHKYSCVLMLL